MAKKEMSLPIVCIWRSNTVTVVLGSDWLLKGGL